MSRNRLSFVALLAFLGALLSGLLLFDHHGVSSAQSAVHQLCGAVPETGCELVSNSQHSTIGGFSLAAVGLFFYGSIMLLLALGLASPSDATRDFAAGLGFAAFLAALAVDVLLLGVQAVAIGAYCRLCLATYAVNGLVLAALWPIRSRIRAVLSGGDLRRALSVWAFGAVVIAVGVGAVDQALAARPTANLLGASEPVPPPPADAAPPPLVSETPVSEPSPPVSERSGPNEAELARLQAQLETAKARIRELQATLDNPQKFQAYQEQKAAQDFEQQPRVEIDLKDVPSKGPAAAPIQVAEFSDFLCPFCRNLAGAFAGFLPQSQGRVAIFFKHYPLDQACNPVMTRTVHDGACELALGGVCAEEQGRFWPYHDRVFGQPPSNPTNEDVVRIATDAGLDADAMRECLSSPGARAKLDRDIAEGRRLDVNATPTVFVNGKRLEQIGAFMKAIESESKRLGLPGASP
jgi:protein-disulfide isomerase/uncharacterized membrane protein